MLGSFANIDQIGLMLGFGPSQVIKRLEQVDHFDCVRPLAGERSSPTRQQ
jgi:hypothetical protein